MPGFAGTVVTFSSGPSASTDFCHVETPFLTQVKLLGSYTMPLDIQVAATFQNIPGPQIAANAVYTSAQIAPSLGRPLSSAAIATINIVPAGTLYGERLNQLDLRLTKILKLGARARILASVDFYNALNASTVIGLNNAVRRDDRRHDRAPPGRGRLRSCPAASRRSGCRSRSNPERHLVRRGRQLSAFSQSILPRADG